MKTMPILAVAAILAASLLPGCTKKVQMDIAGYPGAQGIPAGATVETATGTTFAMVQQTPDGVNTVTEHFKAALGPSWTLNGTRFSDGNLDVPNVASDEAQPKDPTKPGGVVFILETTDRTMIRIWRYLPKPAK